MDGKSADRDPPFYLVEEERKDEVAKRARRNGVAEGATDSSRLVPDPARALVPYTTASLITSTH